MKIIQIVRNAVALSVVVALCSCSGFYVRGHAAYFQPKLTGDVGLGLPGGSNVMTVDVEDTLGIDEQSAPYARVEMGAGLFTATVSGFYYDANGTGTLGAEFGGIPLATNVRSDIEINNVKGVIGLELLDFGFLRISPGVAVDYFDVDVEVSAVNNSVAERVDVDVPVPMGHVRTEVEIGPFQATVDVGAMSANLRDVDGTWVDIDGMLSYRPVSNIEVFGGYRWININTDGTADGRPYEADVMLEGWFVGGGLSF